MNHHDSFETLLAVREDISPAEEARLTAHLQDCEACRRRAAIYERQDVLVRAMASSDPPHELEQEVRERIARSAPDTRRLSPPAWRMAGLALAAVVVLALGIGIITASERTATPANAYDLLRRVAEAANSSFPYTGTSEVSYSDLPLYTLPPRSALYSGNHRAIVHWSARDNRHFRVDIHIISPILDSGYQTIVVNGDKILSYDTRTETAGLGTVLPSPLTKSFAQNLLPFLRNGATWGGGPEPDATQSIQAYVSRAQDVRSQIRGYTRLVGHTRLLGRKVDIVDFAPIGISCQSVTITFHCVHLLRAYGWGRVWIDHDHPFILQYKEYGINNLHDPDAVRIHFVYRVTQVRYGAGPSDADLAFHPPVKVQNAGHWTVGSSEGTEIPNNHRFVYPPPPSRYSAKPWILPAGVPGGQVVGPVRQVTVVDILYTQGESVTTYLPGHHPIGLYAAGSYVYIQERTQVHGLPAALRAGVAHIIGACRMWTGTYSDGERWVAFAKGPTSVLVSTNALSQKNLVRYAYEDICARQW